MQKLLKTYLRRLTNLTGNNRSLLLRRLVANQFADIKDADYLLDKRPAFSVIDDLLAHKKQIPLSALADARDANVNQFSRRLKLLKRNSRFLQEERGAHDLFVAWPFVRGYFADGTPVAAPLLFFPVELEEENRQWVLKPREEGQAIFNKTFLLAFAHFSGFELAEPLFDFSFEKASTDSRVFRTELYQLLKEHHLDIQFNQELFIDQLKPFTTLPKSAKMPENAGELSLYPEAVLGIFPQAGSYLLPDYTHLIEEAELKTIDELFLNARQRAEQGEAWYDRSAEGTASSEADVFAPYQLDASQESALQAVKRGESVVVQGPPGTGKSQLIANLAADGMAHGKRVLIVSQKKAALDVLHQRLDQKQLAHFVALVHDFRNDRKALYKQLADQIDAVEDYRTLNNGLDTIQLERRHLQASRRIEQLVDELQAFKTALYDEQECGISIKELYLSCKRDEKMLDLHREYRGLRFDELSDFMQNLSRFLHLAARVDNQEHPWHLRKSFAGYGPAELQDIRETLEAIYPYVQSILAQLSELLNHEASLDTLTFFELRKESIAELTRLLENETVFSLFRLLIKNEREVDFTWLEQIERGIMQSYLGEGPEIFSTADELGEVLENVARYKSARKNPISRITQRYLKPEGQQVRELLEKNKLEDNSAGIELLELRLDNRLNLEHYITDLRQAAWLPEVPEAARKINYQEWFAQLQLARQAFMLYTKELRDFRHYFNLSKLEYPEFRQQVAQLFTLLRRIPQAKVRWATYLNPGQIERLIRSEAEQRNMQQSLHADFEYLCAYDVIRQEYGQEQLQLFDKIISSSPYPLQEGEQIVGWFLNSLRFAWIQHIETKYPKLRSVSTGMLQEMEKELQQCIREKAAVSQEMLLIRAREQTYNKLTYNRLNKLVSYRDLRHQVNKKRKIWPLRKLLGQHAEEIFQLIPCWMASPESVSAVFPMQEYFDLVIFDEASQCFVEKGLPALFRGRQVVVVGDSQQLQPNDLYQVRWEESDEELPETEIVSLLELARQHLQELYLQTHYRSEVPELIDFSNRYFYEGRLRMLPERRLLNQQGQAIHFHKVQGSWSAGENQAEATALVQHVLTLIKQEKDKERNPPAVGYMARSVGIVTFNQKQQQLIEDLLDEEAGKAGVSLPDDLFVKNIENVQGDERDIIYFSVGYGHDEDGKLRSQFGSLNKAGGENRLNVAISRARSEIQLFCSFWPDELQVKDSLHEGPRLFKAYLLYALQVSDGNYRFSMNEQEQIASGTFLWNALKCIPWPDGIKVDRQLPFADLTARQGQQLAGLILTDDNAYFQNASIKDSHAYLYRQLEDKGWPYRRIFSRQYWEDAELLHQQLNQFIDRLDVY